MSKDIKTFLKYSWIAASIACFIIPLLVIPEEGFKHWPVEAEGDMGFGMFVMAFPASMLYMLFLALVFYLIASSHYDLPASFYVLLWLGFFVTGYLQWFHLLPYFFNRQKSFMTLGLSNIEVEKGERKRRRRTSRSRKRKASQAQIESKPVLQFEQPRRTPLEKVISEN
jgi:hypothetical protein